MYKVCHRAGQLLLDIGITKSRLNLCAGKASWPCHQYPANLKILEDTVGPMTADSVIEYVEHIFSGNMEQLYDEPRTIDHEPPFYCPELDNIAIHQPCAVRSCAFHTDHPWARNCILHYLARNMRYEGRQGPILTNHDLSILLGMSPTAVRSMLTRTLANLRKGALQEEILKEVDTDLVTRIPSANVCAVCERSFEKPYLKKDTISYCSKQCRDKKPPIDIRLEEEFHLSIKRLLTMCAERFSAVAAMANAVGVSQSEFKKLCSRHSVPLRE